MSSIPALRSAWQDFYQDSRWTDENHGGVQMSEYPDTPIGLSGYRGARTRLWPAILFASLLILGACGPQSTPTASLVATASPSALPPTLLPASPSPGPIEEPATALPSPPLPAVPSATTSPVPTEGVVATPSPVPPVSGTGNADVLYVRAVKASNGTWTFHVTVQHPDTGWEDYADGWDVLTPDGQVLKPDRDSPFTRLLLHPHESEQPFTRSQSGIVIPPGVTQVRVRAHDLVDGYGGREVPVDLTIQQGQDFEVETAP